MNLPGNFEDGPKGGKGIRMRLLDTDVMVDLLRDYPPALNWLSSQAQAPGLPGLVLIELLTGCRSKAEMNRLLRLLEPFQLYWPTDQDCRRAVSDLVKGHLTHNLGAFEALIGECTVGLSATLCTFNQKHFRAIPNLVLEKPYPRT